MEFTVIIDDIAKDFKSGPHDFKLVADPSDQSEATLQTDMCKQKP